MRKSTKRTLKDLAIATVASFLMWIGLIMGALVGGIW